MALWKISSKSNWTWAKAKCLKRACSSKRQVALPPGTVDYYRKMMSEHADKVMASQY